MLQKKQVNIDNLQIRLYNPPYFRGGESICHDDKIIFIIRYIKDN
jgi:hypothetical protein